jgi:hypothetical protein
MKRVKLDKNIIYDSPSRKVSMLKTGKLMFSEVGNDLRGPLASLPRIWIGE